MTHRFLLPTRQYDATHRFLSTRRPFLRSFVSPIYDVRKPLDRIRDQIASSAELNLAA
jgi:hypothetical protein